MSDEEMDLVWSSESRVSVSGCSKQQRTCARDTFTVYETKQLFRCMNVSLLHHSTSAPKNLVISSVPATAMQPIFAKQLNILAGLLSLSNSPKRNGHGVSSVRAKYFQDFLGSYRVNTALTVRVFNVLAVRSLGHDYLISFPRFS